VPVSLAFRLVLVVAAAALMVLPAVASAVLSGANGRIAYISGRGFGQKETQLYLRIAQGSLGFGTNSGPFGFSAQQHRHPTWSPDRTKIAYAAGDENCAPIKCDIYVVDLTTPFPLVSNVTNTATVNEDRPAWSPDGSRIAYESEVAAGSGQVDILVDPVGAGATLNLTNTGAAGEFEGKPAWTPDSAEIYYHTGNPTLEGALNIVKEPSGGGTVANIAAAPGINEFQPSLSPDGKQLCFTRGTGAPFGPGAVTNDVIVSLANGGGQNDLSDDAVTANYNCTWSPTGVSVAYVTGAFTGGDLVLEQADDQGFPLTLEAVIGAFDGNPDWAPDGRPVCKDLTVSTPVNQPLTVALECFDTGPFYERTQVRESVSQEPKNGTVTEVVQGDQEPSTFVYTPKPGFSGTETLKYNSFDQIAGFGESKTVTINVIAAPVDPAPVVSNLTVKPRRWELGSGLPQISAAVGAKVRWRLSEPASTKLTFQRALPGRRQGKACVKQTAANASKPPCSRFVNLASRTVPKGKAGPNTFAFQGKVTAAKSLVPGSYRVAAQARDNAGQLGKTALSSLFTVLSN
jgi:Tol biopolymer transport system component